MIPDYVAQAYGIRISRAEKIRRIWRCNTADHGIWGIKWVEYPPEEFDFIWQVSEHLKKQGFTAYPSLIMTGEGRGWVADREKGVWYAVPWLKGREASYEKWEHIRIAVELLINLRRASAGFMPVRPFPGRVHLGRWPNYFNHRLQDLKNFRHLKKRGSEFECLYHHYLDYYIAQAEESLYRLDKTGYFHYCHQAQIDGTFCHHDFAHHNLLIHQGQGRIIDFDYCLYDLHLHDLGSFVLRVMKKNHWKIRLAEKILAYYLRLHNLTETEMKILAVFWQYPQDFWQLGFSYYVERLPRSEKEYLKRLKSVLKQEKERVLFLQEMKRTAQI